MHPSIDYPSITVSDHECLDVTNAMTTDKRTKARLHEKVNNKNLSILHINICSLRNKVGEVEVFLRNKVGVEYDIICFSEHHMHENELNSLVINDYRIVSNYCRKHNKKGGTIILSKPNIISKDRQDIVKDTIEMHCEISAIEITQLNCIIITVYRPPSGNFHVFLNSITNILNKLDLLNNLIILNGDFNIHFNQNNNRTKEFLDLVQSFGMRQQIFQKTSSINCIDNIFINFSNLFKYSTNAFNPYLSDHSAMDIIIDIDKNVPKPQYITKRPITKKGQIKIFQLLENQDWSFINSHNYSTNAKADRFLQIIKNAMTVAFPTIHTVDKGGKKNITWFNEHLRQTRETFTFLNDLYNNFPSPDLKKRVNQYRYIYRQEIYNAKKEANSKYITNSNNMIKSSWEVINSNRKKGSGSKEAHSVLNANELNVHFANVAENIILTLPKSKSTPEKYLENLNLKSDNLNFSFREVTYVEVRDAINNLKNKTSKDIYDMNIMLIKSLKDILIIPITKLINLSIKEGIYPSCLKISKVIPVFKKGEINDMDNYRPITLIPVVSKIYEYLLKAQLYDYFEKNCLFMDNQYGFRAKKSTTLAILDLLEYISEGFEGKQYVVTTFCDLSKAFDSVSHNILITKLAYYGLNKISLKILESYLLERKQVTYFKNNCSNCVDIRHGVPQGSLLGPLLFLIYINDISSAVDDLKIILYADDTTFSDADVDYDVLTERVRVNIAKYNDWFTSNILMLNNTKTVNITFSLRQQINTSNPEEVKFLGVYLDPALTFDNHISHMANKLSKDIFVLKNLKNLVSQKACLQAYHGLFQSVCCYAILTWGHSCHSERIFKLQRRAVRVISGLGYREEVRDKFVELNILTIPCRYIYECLIYAYSNQDKYSKNKCYHEYNTRLNNNIHLEYLRLRRTRLASNYYAPLFFNKLPQNIKLLPIDKYKLSIKKMLLSQAFYNVQEFLDSNLF